MWARETLDKKSSARSKLGRTIVAVSAFQDVKTDGRLCALSL